MDILRPSAKGKRSLIQILEAWANTRPDKIHVSIPLSADVSKGFRDVTHREIRDAADTFAWWLVDNYGQGEGFETIAFVGVNDLRYTVVFFGAIKAGYKSLFVSPRNPANTNVSLLEQTKCRRFLYSSEMASVARDVTTQMPNLDTAEVAPFDHWLRAHKKPFPFKKSFEDSKWDPILVLHSSGSTEIPKPVTLPNGFFAATDSAMRPIPGRSLSGTTASSFDGGGFYFSPFPPTHLAGANALIYQLLIALEASAIIGLADRPPTPQFILDIIKHKKPRVLYSPPSLIEMISQLPGGMDALKTCECIIYAGGPLSKTCGDQLTHHVKLSTVYGSTETGNNHMLMPQPDDWDYIEFHPDFSLRMDPAVDGASELVFSQDDPNSVVRGVSWSYPHIRDYRTRDMFMPHPSKPGLWKFYGRNDDIIVFSNGAKYNPVPAESVIASNEKLTGVLILGDGRTQAAALIEPKAEPSSLANLIDELWPYVERANEKSQKQGHLTRSQIAIVQPGSLIRAAKGTVVRTLTCNKFKSLIEELYADESTDISVSRGIQIATPYSLNTSMLDFVRECVRSISMMSGIGDKEDLFVRGLDSVQTRELLRIIKTGLRPHCGETPWLSGQWVFEYPSVEKLAGALEQGIQAQSTLVSHDVKASVKFSKTDSILATIAKYSRDLGQADGFSDETQRADYTTTGLSVVLTGSTGSLGLRILQRLIKDSDVSSITCLDRSRDARSRVAAVTNIRDSSKATFLQAQFSEANLGLNTETYAKLRDHTHVIIRCAWTVDFNHSLESFEPVHICGVANLIDLSYSSRNRARIVFMSSTSSVRNWTELYDSERPTPEMVIEDPSVAASMGYGQSKYVSEHILANAAHKSAGKLPVTILRIGQVAGPVDKPVEGPPWNSAEWFPSLVKTSKALRCVPKDLPRVDWIPVDRLGSIISEIVRADTPKPASVQPQVYNIVNPHSIAWAEVLKIIQTRLGSPEIFPAVSIHQWLQKLREIPVDDEETLLKYPALKLVPFFEAMSEKGSRAELRLTTDNGQNTSSTFAALSGVPPQWVEAWIEGCNL